MRLLVTVVISMLSLALAGCAAHSARGQPKATLAFAKPGTTKGFLGSFRTLDGRSVPDTPAVISLAPGRRTVGYWCPDTITMDGPPTVTATFEPGKAYVLHCAANQPAVVTEQLPARQPAP